LSRLPANLRWEEVANVLTKLGYRLERKRGSHALFVNEKGRMAVVVMKSPVKRGALEVDTAVSILWNSFDYRVELINLSQFW